MSRTPSSATFGSRGTPPDQSLRSGSWCPQHATRSPRVTKQAAPASLTRVMPRAVGNVVEPSEYTTSGGADGPPKPIPFGRGLPFFHPRVRITAGVARAVSVDGAAGAAPRELACEVHAPLRARRRRRSAPHALRFARLETRVSFVSLPLRLPADLTPRASLKAERTERPTRSFERPQSRFGDIAGRSSCRSPSLSATSTTRKSGPTRRPRMSSTNAGLRPSITCPTS